MRDVHDRGAQAGFALLEVLIALGILALIITTALAIFIDRQNRLLMASESVVASQGLANEAELRRRVAFTSFRLGAVEPFLTVEKKEPSDVLIVESLPSYRHEVLATEVAPGVIAVRMTLFWGSGSPQRSQSLTILRTGARLW